MARDVPYRELVKILMSLPKERLAELLVERAGISAEWVDGETDAAVLRGWLAYDSDKRSRSVVSKLTNAEGA